MQLIKTTLVSVSSTGRYASIIFIIMVIFRKNLGNQSPYLPGSSASNVLGINSTHFTAISSSHQRQPIEQIKALKETKCTDLNHKKKSSTGLTFYLLINHHMPDGRGILALQNMYQYNKYCIANS